MRRTSNRQKRLSGTDQRCRIRPNEAEAPLGRPDPPLPFRVDGAAEVYDRLADALEAQGTLTVADGVTLWSTAETGAELAARYTTAQSSIFRAWLSSLGLTPAARKRILQDLEG